jgi:acyl-CoA synthetase (AMP-forming)/AMP-acid ligase II
LIVDASADTFFSGYLNRPDATAEKLRNGWYFTGDVCVLRDDGDVDLVGRLDDVIRSGGESVYPEEVEAVLATHPAIREARSALGGDGRRLCGAHRDWCALAGSGKADRFHLVDG